MSGLDTIARSLLNGGIIQLNQAHKEIIREKLSQSAHSEEDLALLCGAILGEA